MEVKAELGSPRELGLFKAGVLDDLRLFPESGSNGGDRFLSLTSQSYSGEFS